MENKTVPIVGTGFLSHYKKGVAYDVPVRRFRTLPKEAYTSEVSKAEFAQEVPEVLNILTARAAKKKKTEESKANETVAPEAAAKVADN